jgi:hypothetical protein
MQISRANTPQDPVKTIELLLSDKSEVDEFFGKPVDKYANNEVENENLFDNTPFELVEAAS